MKKIHNTIKAACLLGLTAVATTSCQDWLTIYPQTQVVEENYWEDKNDLEGVRYGAYKQLCGNLEKIVLWGDLRSDSYDLNGSDESTGTQQLYREIREGKIDRDSANTYFDWSGFYTGINYCNKVLQHGPEVLEKDKQFTPAEWSQMNAEITALRALNYFYLIRAFKDVPYSTTVINNDTQVTSFGATNQLVVLDSLITDVENIQGQARNRFSSIKDTKGMITNTAIYAMLSDMYLWRASLHEGRGITVDTVMINNIKNPSKVKNVTMQNDSTYVVHTVEGDYKLAIEYADLALEALAKQNEDRSGGFMSSRTLTENYGLTNCNMIKNTFDNFIGHNQPMLTAHSEIFGDGNSDESIFELQFNRSDSRSNGVVTSQWGYSNKVHLAVSDGAIAAIYQSTDERCRDSRMWFSGWNKLVSSTNTLPGYYCFKWYELGIMTPDNVQCSDIKIMPMTDGNDYRNWIIYRMSDVMLQKAEAMAALGQGQDAMQYVNAIHRRWYCNDSKTVTGQPVKDVTNANGKKLVTGSPTSDTMGNAPAPTQGNTNYEIAVLNERQLEFLGEGKRWFDLVRYAERHAGGMDGTQDPREYTEENPIGNGKKGVDLMVDNFLRNQYSTVYQTLKNRFKNRYGLYNIIYYMEIKASNGMLEQNPVWNKTTYEL